MSSGSFLSTVLKYVVRLWHTCTSWGVGTHARQNHGGVPMKNTMTATSGSSAEAPLRKVSAGVKFRGRRRREPLPETTPNMAAIRGSHFVTRVVCVLMS